MTSPYLSKPLRSEAEVRKSIADELRSEGANDAMIARLTTDKSVKRMVDYEAKALEFIATAFQPKGDAL